MQNTYRKPYVSRQQRMKQQAESSDKRRQDQALSLITRYRDIFDLLCDAIFLGQVSSINNAYRYVMEVRNQRYLPENPEWKERNELFRLASSQRI